MNILNAKRHHDNKLFFLIFLIMFTVFIFTNSAHRISFDEDLSQKQAMYIVEWKPSPSYVPGNSTILYEYPIYFPHPHAPVCRNAILCSPASIGSSLTEVPFVFINHYWHVIKSDTIVLDSNDFDDPAYVFWRNGLNPDFTFLQLFYGPLFSALSVGIFFLLCRNFNFNEKNSVILAFLLALTVLLWTYSKTSFNIVPAVFFTLLGFLLFRKFQKNNSNIDLILCSSSLGFGFLTRQDAVLIILPLFLFLLYNLRKQNGKIKIFLSFVIPVLSSYVISLVIDFMHGYGSVASAVTSSPARLIPTSQVSDIHVHIIGLLSSPGIGLFIFAPLLLTVFFSFPDFYKRNKAECLLILSFPILFLSYYGAGGGGYWHGLIAWGPRYLIVIIPFLLLPLGASIEKRKSKNLKIVLLILAGIGFLFNLVYMVQDVSWFVWGNASLHTGLFGIEKNGLYPLNIHPATIWTFEFSPLTQSIITAFTHLQPDIFLLKILGALPFGVVLVAILSVLIYLLVRSLCDNPKTPNKIS